MIFIDLFTVFDTVDHNICLVNLKTYGVQSENLKWFRNYLSNRKQSTSYDDFKIKMKSVKCGIPKGSILQPQQLVLDPVFLADDNNIRTLSETINQELKFFLKFLCVILDEHLA